MVDVATHISKRSGGNDEQNKVNIKVRKKNRSTVVSSFKILYVCSYRGVSELASLNHVRSGSCTLSAEKNGILILLVTFKDFFADNVTSF